MCEFFDRSFVVKSYQNWIIFSKIILFYRDNALKRLPLIYRFTGILKVLDSLENTIEISALCFSESVSLSASILLGEILTSWKNIFPDNRLVIKVSAEDSFIQRILLEKSFLQNSENSDSIWKEFYIESTIKVSYVLPVIQVDTLPPSVFNLCCQSL